MNFDVTMYLRRRGLAAVAMVLAGSLLACTEAKPVSYPMRSTFDFGNVQMSVDGTESGSDLSRKAILVRATVNNFDGESQARVAGQSWNQWFRLTDKDGKKYGCKRFLPTDYYYQSYSGGTRGGEKAISPEDAYSPVPSQWIMRFEVPLDAEGFTLLIDNMTFHKGSQPVAIAVPLDR